MNKMVMTWLGHSNVSLNKPLKCNIWLLGKKPDYITIIQSYNII